MNILKPNKQETTLPAAGSTLIPIEEYSTPQMQKIANREVKANVRKRLLKLRKDRDWNLIDSQTKESLTPLMWVWAIITMLPVYFWVSLGVRGALHDRWLDNPQNGPDPGGMSFLIAALILIIPVGIWAILNGDLCEKHVIRDRGIKWDTFFINPLVWITRKQIEGRYFSENKKDLTNEERSLLLHPLENRDLGEGYLMGSVIDNNGVGVVGDKMVPHFTIYVYIKNSLDSLYLDVEEGIKKINKSLEDISKCDFDEVKLVEDALINRKNVLVSKRDEITASMEENQESFRALSEEYNRLCQTLSIASAVEVVEASVLLEARIDQVLENVKILNSNMRARTEVLSESVVSLV